MTQGRSEDAIEGGSMTRCPECEADLELDGYELDVGETVNCPECSMELRIVSNDPVSVAVLGEDE
jgi:alpha-aminoadipate/glutamate carrier protein LysW